MHIVLQHHNFVLLSSSELVNFIHKMLLLFKIICVNKINKKSSIHENKKVQLLCMLKMVGLPLKKVDSIFLEIDFQNSFYLV